ncbi:hypothetical protein SDRG_11682 [Saprolegnia diclina VS20]|uniref:Uncharacterized protein n=1 Tax=Saprolegnia diclina (strain VS20) TaxID=1156394 RepID=T0RL22_SAPDV|nr:hypothetical protein SDRG_11682 [Saprolegnia diclina VS20]EQC30627.1 hypothetical protein SDRG_11682 [Saprolegnia diclina VS20]|eukprot:XP_008615953.1 hypothetical protein SDRG_11682 [Saprolegnia diclina VS20]
MDVPQTIVNNLVSYASYLNVTSAHLLDLSTASPDEVPLRYGVFATLVVLGLLLGTRGHQVPRLLIGVLMIPVGLAGRPVELLGCSELLCLESLGFGLLVGALFAARPAWAIRLVYCAVMARTFSRVLGDLPHKDLIAPGAALILATLVLEFKDSTVRAVAMVLSSILGALLVVSVSTVAIGPVTLVVYGVMAMWFYRIQREHIAKLTPKSKQD